MPVSKRLRYEVLRRDNHACRYCGAVAPDVKLTIDHVTPVALGGTDTADNLVTACASCNSGKSSATPDAQRVAEVSDDALRWAEAMKQAAANLAKQENVKLEYRAAFRAEWDRWGIGEGEQRKLLPLPGDWKPSIENFRLAGLPAWVWPDIVDAAMGRDKVLAESKFKYCCGIAWNKVTELQTEARRLTASSAATTEEDDSAERAFVEVALIAWGTEWSHAFEHGPSPDQEAEFRTSALDLLLSGESPHELIESAQHAAWHQSCNLSDGLTSKREQEEFIKRYRVTSSFENAWYVTHGEQPPRDTSNGVWDACKAMCDAGAAPEFVSIAAVWAAAHGTDQLHYGLSEENCAVTGVSRVRQQIEDAWAAAWKTADLPLAWPTQEDREALRAELQRLADQELFTEFDMYTAAASAGVYRDIRLAPHLPLGGSAFLAARALHLAWPARE